MKMVSGMRVTGGEEESLRLMGLMCHLCALGFPCEEGSAYETRQSGFASGPCSGGSVQGKSC